MTFGIHGGRKVEETLRNNEIVTGIAEGTNVVFALCGTSSQEVLCVNGNLMHPYPA